MSTLLPLWLPQDPSEDAVDFDLEDFRLALFQKGRELVWDQAISCPCQTRSRPAGRGQDVEYQRLNESRVDCPGCGGGGIIYDNRQTTYAMLTDAMSDQKFFNLYSRYSEGTVFITLLPEHMPAARDRFTLTRGVVTYEETNFIHKTTVERPRFPIVKRTMYLGSETNPYEPEEVAVGVMYMRAAGLDGVLLPTKFTENVHFTVTDEGAVDWTLAGELEPPIGARVSIRYYGRPAFTVTGFPFAQRDLYQNDAGSLEERYLGLHPIKVVAVPEFWGARTPPVVGDVTTAEAAPHRDW
jgi:hypothetical protein